MIANINKLIIWTVPLALVSVAILFTLNVHDVSGGRWHNDNLQVDYPNNWDVDSTPVDNAQVTFHPVGEDSVLLSFLMTHTGIQDIMNGDQRHYADNGWSLVQDSANENPPYRIYERDGMTLGMKYSEIPDGTGATQLLAPTGLFRTYLDSDADFSLTTASSNGPSSNGPSSNGPSSNGPSSNGPSSNGPNAGSTNFWDRCAADEKCTQDMEMQKLKMQNNINNMAFCGKMNMIDNFDGVNNYNCIP